MITAIIVDDIENAREGLSSLIDQTCKDVVIVGKASSAQEAIDLIKKMSPELVFLDIKMPNKNGFQMLEEIGKIDFEVIFTTAYEEFAIKAFRFSALDYLTKPISPKLLVDAIDKHRKKQKIQLKQQRFEILFENSKNSIDSFEKLAVPTPTGLTMLNISNVIYCKGDGNYTNIFQLNSEKPILSSKTLKYYEELLPSSTFFRAHKSTLLNLNMVKQYLKTEGNTAIMVNGNSVEVSERNKKKFTDRLLRKD